MGNRDMGKFALNVLMFMNFVALIFCVKQLTASFLTM
jgi:hypothetical protein